MLYKFVETFDILTRHSFPVRLPLPPRAFSLGRQNKRLNWNFLGLQVLVWQDCPFTLFVQHIAQQRLQKSLYSTIVIVIMRKRKKRIWPSEGSKRDKPLTDPFSAVVFQLGEYLYLQAGWEASWLCSILLPLNNMTRCLNDFLIESGQFVIICCSPGGYRKIPVSFI